MSKYSSFKSHQLITENWRKYLGERPSLQERLSPLGHKGGDIKKALGLGPGIHKITPRSTRGLGRHWEPWDGHRFRYLDPQDVQDKIAAIEKEMLGGMWEFVSGDVAEKVERGKEQADASDEGRGLAKFKYWMDFVDGIKRPNDPEVNEELLGKFVDDPRAGKSNDYIVMGSWQGPEGTKFADEIFIVFKTLGKIYFVDQDKGFIKEDPHYYLAVIEQKK